MTNNWGVHQGVFAQKGLVLFLILPLILFTFSPQCYGQASPTPSPSGSGITVSDFDRICGSALASSGSSSPTPTASSSSSSDLQQLLQYCQAAQSAKTAYDADNLLWKIWAAVGIVCFGACAASFYNMGNQYICMGTSAAAALGDAAITKQFMGAMSAIMGLSGAYMMNQMANGGSNSNQNQRVNPESPEDPQKTTQTSGSRDIGACMLGATAIYQAVSKSTQMATQKGTLISNLTNAQSYASAAPATTTSNTYSGGSAPLSYGSTGGMSAYGGQMRMNPMMGMMGMGTMGMMGGRMSCGGMYGGGMYGGGMMTRCAVGIDSNLPPNINTPKFHSDFNKLTGLPLASFGNLPNDTPVKAIGRALASSMSNNDSAQTMAALQQMEQQISERTPSSVYAGGGGFRNSHGESEPNMNEMMSNMMNQFLPKHGEEGKESGLATVIFANQRLQASAIPEDRTLNIFDRVSYRYHFVGNRVLEEAH